VVDGPVHLVHCCPTLNPGKEGVFGEGSNITFKIVSSVNENDSYEFLC
jgi:hypothetical protein